jgi:peroxiredoxin family protein
MSDIATQALEVLRARLLDQDTSLRRDAVKRCPSLARALGPKRTATELLPILHQCVVDVDYVAGASELHYNTALAMQEIVKVFPTDDGINRQSLVPLLGALLSSEETLVRHAAVEVFRILVRQSSPAEVQSQVATAFVPTLASLTESAEYQHRVAACDMLVDMFGQYSSSDGDDGGNGDDATHVAYDNNNSNELNSGVINNNNSSSSSSSSSNKASSDDFFIAIMRQFASDQNPLVREQVCVNFGSIFRQCFPDVSSTATTRSATALALIDVADRLLGDNDEDVALRAHENCLPVLAACSESLVPVNKLLALGTSIASQHDHADLRQALAQSIGSIVRERRDMFLPPSSSGDVDIRNNKFSHVDAEISSAPSSSLSSPSPTAAATAAAAVARNSPMSPKAALIWKKRASSDQGRGMVNVNLNAGRSIASCAIDSAGDPTDILSATATASAIAQSPRLHQLPLGMASPPLPPRPPIPATPDRTTTLAATQGGEQVPPQWRRRRDELMSVFRHLMASEEWPVRRALTNHLSDALLLLSVPKQPPAYTTAHQVVGASGCRDQQACTDDILFLWDMLLSACKDLEVEVRSSAVQQCVALLSRVEVWDSEVDGEGECDEDTDTDDADTGTRGATRRSASVDAADVRMQTNSPVSFVEAGGGLPNGVNAGSGWGSTSADGKNKR